MEHTQDKFNGFSKKTLTFLKGLKANNNKTWFDAHRQEYEEHLLTPFRLLVIELGESMLGIDPQFETRPAVGKTLSRMFRDTRFSKDKSPYRHNMWFVFKRAGKNWIERPSFFFEIFPDYYHFGMGFYSAEKTTMDAFRRFINEHPREFRSIIAFYPKQRTFTLEGEEYKKILAPDKSAEIRTWYQRRNIYLICSRKANNRLFSPRLAAELQKGFAMLAPLYRLFMKLILQSTKHE